MSAHTIATETLIQKGGLTIDLAKALHTKYPELPSAEDMINHPDFAQFFTDHSEVQKKKKKKVSIDDRRGVYDGEKCNARVWHEKKGSGGLGYDDIQCHCKKIKGEEFCKQHAQKYKEGNLWTGKITEPRPENPTKPDGTLMFWSTDEHGDDIVKEKKKSTKKEEKKSSKKVKNKSLNDMTINELLEVLKEKGWDGEGYISNKGVIDTKEKEEIVDDEAREGSEGGIGAGVGFEESGENDGLIKTISSDSNKTEPCSHQESSEDEEECYTIREIDGIDYQINNEDHTVIRIKDFEIVGKWDQTTNEITFNEEDE
tara:strand:- start:3399 stop:4340 length:942 start_codon:yes stop_codon:yes gene_type:complete